jgi:hypothetical protein
MKNYIDYPNGIGSISNQLSQFDGETIFKVLIDSKHLDYVTEVLTRPTREISLMEGMLRMAKNRIHNMLLDNSVDNVTVTITGSKLVLVFSNGRNLVISDDEVKHQAIEFIKEL